MLLRELLLYTDEELAELSDHAGGNAVDLVPMETKGGTPTHEGVKVLLAMYDHPLTKDVLTREGGKSVWHLAIRAST